MTVIARRKGLLEAAILAAVLWTFTDGLVATAAEQIAAVSASDAAANDSFGSSISISGNVAAVGAPGKNALTGAVYLYDVATGSQIRKLSGDFPGTSAFGQSVAFAGSSLVVGAPLEGNYGAA